MIFGGSSVTAGHDNYFNQSYPKIVEKRMGKIFSALGIELIVRNIAMGANPCFPYELCYEAQGGSDADFYGWEQSYNCGRDAELFELFGRWGGWSRNRGLIYFSASGFTTPAACSPSRDHPPFSDEDWTPESAALPPWRPGRAEVVAEKQLLNKFHEARSSSSRYTGYLHCICLSI